MKARSKQELAESAGVSVETLVKWLRPFKEELEAMGLQPGMRILPPHIVKYISEKLCIDI